jgi:uncharacterized protein (DUF4415 family)
MKQTSTTKMPDTSDDDAPKLTQADFDRAQLRVGGKVVSHKEWQEAVRAHIGKQRVNIMLDAPIVAHFKALAGERGYQTLINQALHDAMRGDQIEEIIRRTIREELHAE